MTRDKYNPDGLKLLEGVQVEHIRTPIELLTVICVIPSNHAISEVISGKACTVLIIIDLTSRNHTKKKLANLPVSS